MALIQQEIKEGYALYNGDCCEVLPSIPDASVGHVIYSPPFSELYQYSSSDRDLSNCRDYDEFLEHYSFVVEQTARTIMPGRIAAIHCMDLRVNSRHARDFPGDIVRLHEKHGFEYCYRVTIWKDPLRQAIRTRVLHLRHGQLVKDSAACGIAGGDYLIIMRKKGENKIPIEHPHGLTRYAGTDLPPEELVAKYKNWPDPKTNKLSHYIWQRYASTVWMDIHGGNVLPYQGGRECEEEKHICPLQLDAIERSITLWSNPGEVVLTPFLGIGSEAYVAVALGRKAIGIELKESYFRQAVKNLQGAKAGTYIMEEPDFLDGVDFDD